MLNVTYRSENYEKAVQADPGFSPGRKPSFQGFAGVGLHKEATAT